MRYLRPGLESVRRSWRPFVSIQIVAFLLVAVYYSSPSVQAFSEKLAQIKTSGGFLFSGVTTIVASVAIPWIAATLTRSKVDPITPRELLFRCGFFASIGVMVDVWYLLLAGTLGQAHGLSLVLIKVLVDQFIFSPLISIPYSSMCLMWRDAGFKAFKLTEFPRRYAQTIVTCWAFWLPALCAIFAMPTALQFVLYLFIQAAWSLIIIGLKL